MDSLALMDHWTRLRRLPGGRRIFSRLLGRAVPYSGTLRALVLELDPGHARVRLTDRRGLRNHLGSVHAVALVNLGELTSGLALLAGLPPEARGIVMAIETEFLKKARGVLVAQCRCDPPGDAAEREVEVTCHVRDETGDEVSRTRVRWKVGPRVRPEAPAPAAGTP